jgi:hypothetical protein
MLDHWVTVMQVYTGSGLCVSWVLCFYNMGWTGTLNLLKFHNSFISSLVFHIFTDLALTCQGTYLTSTARSHATDNNLHEGAVIGDFNGEFWGVYALHQVIIFLALDWWLYRFCFFNLKKSLKFKIDSLLNLFCSLLEILLHSLYSVMSRYVMVTLHILIILL